VGFGISAIKSRGSPTGYRKKVNICSILLIVGFLLALFLDPEDGSNIFLQNLWLLPN
jgi:hypothetical protein